MNKLFNELKYSRLVREHIITIETISEFNEHLKEFLKISQRRYRGGTREICDDLRISNLVTIGPNNLLIYEGRNDNIGPLDGAHYGELKDMIFEIKNNERDYVPSELENYALSIYEKYREHKILELDDIKNMLNITDDMNWSDDE